MPHTILFTGGTLPEGGKKRLEDRGYTVKIERPDLSEDELIAALEGVSAYILGGAERASRRVIESAKDLKAIAFFGVGYESFVDAAAATEHGIAVTNTPGANAQSVAEFTIALMLGAVKRLVYLIECTRLGDWKEYATWNIQGKTLGVVGLGTIGFLVARIAHNGFGMDILYTGRASKPHLEGELEAQFVPLDELLQRSDIVTLHASASPETHGIIGDRQIRLMKQSSILVNAARSDLVDPVALRSALSERRIAAAAFDGYYREPVPIASEDTSGLVALSSELMLISPHTAYLTYDSIRNMTDMSVDSVIAVLEGRTPEHLANSEYRKHVKF